MLNRSIILCGFMASGKTTVGKALSKKLHVSYVDTDELLVKTYKMSIPAIFEKYGEEYFRDLEHKMAERVAEMDAGVVSTGGGMLTFDRNGKVLKEKGIIVCLTRNFDKIYEALKANSNRPLAQGRSKAEIRQLYEMRVAKYQKYADHIVENTGSVGDCVEKIIAVIDGNMI